MTKDIGRLFFLIAAHLLVLSCGKPTRHYTYQPLELNQGANNKILFLSFRIEANGDSASKVQIINQHTVDGTLRETLTDTSPTRLEIQLLDKSKKVLSTASLEHPLNKRVEYVDGKGQLAVKYAVLQNQEFFIRVTPRASAVFVNINEFRENIVVGSTLFKLALK